MPFWKYFLSDSIELSIIMDAREHRSCPCVNAIALGDKVSDIRRKFSPQSKILVACEKVLANFSIYCESSSNRHSKNIRRAYMAVITLEST